MPVKHKQGEKLSQTAGAGNGEALTHSEEQILVRANPLKTSNKYKYFVEFVLPPSLEKKILMTLVFKGLKKTQIRLKVICLLFFIGVTA